MSLMDFEKEPLPVEPTGISQPDLSRLVCFYSWCFRSIGSEENGSGGDPTTLYGIRREQRGVTQPRLVPGTAERNLARNHQIEKVASPLSWSEAQLRNFTVVC